MYQFNSLKLFLTSLSHVSELLVVFTKKTKYQKNSVLLGPKVTECENATAHESWYIMIAFKLNPQCHAQDPIESSVPIFRN